MFLKDKAANHDADTAQCRNQVMNRRPVLSGLFRARSFGNVCADTASSPRAWINTRSGIRKGIRLPVRGSEPAQHMFARKH